MFGFWMIMLLVAILRNIFEFCIIRIFWSGTLYYSKVPRGVSWSRTFRYSTSQYWFENIKKFHQISEYSDIACMGTPFKNASWCIFFCIPISCAYNDFWHAHSCLTIIFLEKSPPKRSQNDFLKKSNFAILSSFLLKEPL